MQHYSQSWFFGFFCLTMEYMPFLSHIVDLLKSIDLHYFTREVLIGAEGRVIKRITVLSPTV